MKWHHPKPHYFPEYANDRFTLRCAVPDDLDAIIAIEDASFAIPWSRDSYRHELISNPDACYLVVTATDDDTVLGFIGFHRLQDEAEVMNLAVRPESRGMGVAKLLLTGLIAWVKRLKIDRVFLEVRESHEVAIGLYRGFGFEEAGRRKGYYRDNGESALIFALTVE